MHGSASCGTQLKQGLAGAWMPVSGREAVSDAAPTEGKQKASKQSCREQRAGCPRKAASPTGGAAECPLAPGRGAAPPASRPAFVAAVGACAGRWRRRGRPTASSRSMVASGMRLGAAPRAQFRAHQRCPHHEGAPGAPEALGAAAAALTPESHSLSARPAGRVGPGKHHKCAHSGLLGEPRGARGPRAREGSGSVPGALQLARGPSSPQPSPRSSFGLVGRAPGRRGAPWGPLFAADPSGATGARSLRRACRPPLAQPRSPPPAPAGYQPHHGDRGGGEGAGGGPRAAAHARRGALDGLDAARISPPAPALGHSGPRRWGLRRSLAAWRAARRPGSGVGSFG